MLSLGKLIHPLLICFTGPDGVFADGRWFYLFFSLYLLSQITLELKEIFGLFLSFGVCFLFVSFVCCKKVMLGYLPHCADIGCEPTSVALMYKEERVLSSCSWGFSQHFPLDTRAAWNSSCHACSSNDSADGCCDQEDTICC
ncbi:uncharacterized protein LOC104897077 isoform X1 [Beta vulgaris subsp. vulgaris]|uniref:uncharacterized protein LOC104897077 isoform X1 n=1 Tax=Beta vulgaris subsp. vulgaris TaxID=3555 RepID=UPI0020374558|nr:uncharacterized protein LOC104897077 isoform X1 [Beta vulgaris subsp. vulgaris]